MAVLDHLKYGKANAIKIEDIIALTGHNKRAVQKELERLRKEGLVILSNSISSGFWIADEKDEDIEIQLKKYIHKSNSYINNRNKSTQSAKKMLQEIEQRNQQRLE